MTKLEKKGGGQNEWGWIGEIKTVAYHEVLLGKLEQWHVKAFNLARKKGAMQRGWKEGYERAIRSWVRSIAAF